MLCLCNSLPPKEVCESLVCLIAKLQTYCANLSKNLKGLKVSLEDKSEPNIIAARRYWDNSSGR